MAAQTTLSVEGTRIDEAVIAQLRDQVRGTLLTPSDPGYDEARAVRNGLIDRYPAVIARCSGTADVVACVNAAREHDLLLSVRGGGHNVAGNAVNDGGLVIDLSEMRGVWVDPAAGTVTAQGGATWADVDRETQLFGLAAPGGVISSTGIGGLTLHGGYGHLRRIHGLSIDNLLAVEIVTADGQIRTASATETPELFWAVRGAGSNFGVVTRFTYQLHPVGPMVYLCAPVYPQEEAMEVLTAWRDIMAVAPDAVNSLAVLWSVPEYEHFPPELWRKPIVVIAAVYIGPVEEGEQLLQPLRELVTPLMDLSGPTPYTALQSGFDPFFPEGRLYYWKSTFVDDLSDAAIATMIDVARARPSAMSDLTLWHLGGAMGRVAEDATAYGRRDAPFLVTAEATWEDATTSDANIAWARTGLARLQEFSRGGAYLNFPGFGEEKEALLRASYGSNYDRLIALKTQYDPANLFRMNLNLAPRS